MSLNVICGCAIAVGTALYCYESWNQSRRFSLWQNIYNNTYCDWDASIGQKKIRQQYFLQNGTTYYCPDARRKINQVINQQCVEYEQILKLERWSIAEFLKRFGFFQYTEKKEIDRD